MGSLCSVCFCLNKCKQHTGKPGSWGTHPAWQASHHSDSAQHRWSLVSRLICEFVAVLFPKHLSSSGWAQSEKPFVCGRGWPFSTSSRPFNTGLDASDVWQRSSGWHHKTLSHPELLGIEIVWIPTLIGSETISGFEVMQVASSEARQGRCAGPWDLLSMFGLSEFQVLCKDQQKQTRYTYDSTWFSYVVADTDRTGCWFLWGSHRLAVWPLFLLAQWLAEALPRTAFSSQNFQLSVLGGSRKNVNRNMIGKTPKEQNHVISPTLIRIQDVSLHLAWSCTRDVP